MYCWIVQCRAGPEPGALGAECIRVRHIRNYKFLEGRDSFRAFSCFQARCPNFWKLTSLSKSGPSKTRRSDYLCLRKTCNFELFSFPIGDKYNPPMRNFMLNKRVVKIGLSTSQFFDKMQIFEVGSKWSSTKFPRNHDETEIFLNIPRMPDNYGT